MGAVLKDPIINNIYIEPFEVDKLTPDQIFNNRVFKIFQTIGRAFVIPSAGVIFFLQGWRLDPILQLACVLLGIGIAVEIVPTFIDDYHGWRKRTGRAKASIIVNSQPDDSA